MNPTGALWQDVSEIIAAAFAVGLIGLLVVNASGTATVVKAGAGGLSQVLATATFQGSGLQLNQFGNGFGSY